MNAQSQSYMWQRPCLDVDSAKPKLTKWLFCSVPKKVQSEENYYADDVQEYARYV